ncbi:DNA-3-methyladenine glycosylase family protein [Kocuria sp.]|uniref:DNA-3-methyladenine glycosylase family protein n=1 Tax=Kocuria sp. TaxID=1871328 RepID=UPI0026DF6FE9|nr:hypothetical protein [Kocuria sp.]MDO5617450.1 hypothetical protein [Kocuria sp.]
MSAAAPAQCRWSPSSPVNLRATMRGLTRGSSHPTARITADDAVWVTTRCDGHPVTARFSRCGSGPALWQDIQVHAWGTTAELFLAEAPAWTGERDDWQGFMESPAWSTLPDVLQRARREHPGVRLISTGRLVDTLVNTVLEQRVTGGEAVRAQRWLSRAHGQPAPGPAPDGMRVFPDAPAIRQIPSWAWHSAGVDAARAQTVQAVVVRAAAIQRWDSAPLGPALHRALGSIPGIGPWTVAETLQLTHGDPDSVSVFDYHVAHHVTEFFDGHRGDDARMLELLEPWRGHRQRVVRLIGASGHRAQPKGPRLSPQDYRRI